MTDAFTDVAKMKKIKEEIKAHEGQVVEMTLENGRKRQKKAGSKRVWVPFCEPNLHINHRASAQEDP